MRAGELRNRIVIQTPDDAASRVSGERSWNTFATVWAKIVQASDSEGTDSSAKKRQASATHLITMRFLRGLNPSMRITFEGRTFTVETIRNTDERNREIVIEAREDTDAETGY